MTLRRANRRRRQTVPEASLPVRALQFATSWEGIISLSVLVVLAVLVQGILRLPFPFQFGRPSPPPDTWGYITVSRGSSMKLAYIGDVSGGADLDTPGAKQAVELALKERGAIKGLKVKLTPVEDSCDPQKAIEKARELSQDPQVVGVISQACPASALAEKNVFEEVKLPFLSLSSTDPALTSQGSSLVTFRLLWNAARQGRDAALYARQGLGARRALLLHDGSPGAEAVDMAFRAQFRPQGGQIVDLQQVDPAGKDWDSLLKAINKLEADLVYFSGGGSTAGALLSFLRGGGYSGLFMVTDSVYRDLDLAGLAAEGTYATTLQTQRSERYPFWKETYEKEYGAMGTLSPEAYDAATILLQALELAARSKSDGSVEVGRQLLAGSIRSLPYEGVTGRSAFDANGDRGSVLVQVMKFENGEFRQVQ